MEPTNPEGDGKHKHLNLNRVAPPKRVGQQLPPVGANGAGMPEYLSYTTMIVATENQGGELDGWLTVSEIEASTSGTYSKDKDGNTIYTETRTVTSREVAVSPTGEKANTASQMTQQVTNSYKVDTKGGMNFLGEQITSNEVAITSYFEGSIGNAVGQISISSKQHWLVDHASDFMFKNNKQSVLTQLSDQHKTVAKAWIMLHTSILTFGVSGPVGGAGGAAAGGKLADAVNSLYNPSAIGATGKFYQESTLY